VRELEEVRQRLRDEEASREARLQHRLELVQRLGIADGDELRRVAVEPGAEVADDVDLEVLEVGLASRLRRHLRHVEEVVDVAVEMEAGGDDGVHRLAGLRQWDGNVEEELARRRVGDGRSLVADDEIVEPCLLEVGPHRSEHPAGDDDDAGTCRSRPSERVASPRAQDAVLGNQGSVEVEREGGDARRETGRELYGYGALPPVEATT
jgi:hypothetical protein